jgi:predicted nucleic acid-binding protein
MPKRSRMAAKSARTKFIVDNSVWARLHTTPKVRHAFEAIVNAHSPAVIMVCPPVVTEIGFSARNSVDHTTLMQSLSAFPDCPTAPTSRETLVVQHALWARGLVRSVGATDTLIVAYAIANDATVLHFDSDFEYVAQVVPAFKHRWIVPRKSI